MIVGLDIGTTGVKAIAVGPEGEVVARAERGYLDLLAGRLQLPDALVDHIEATVSGATV